MNRIYEHLNEALPVEIDLKFDNINSGGCGVFAYIMARELTKIGIEVKVAWLDSCDSDDFWNAYKTIKESNSTYTLKHINSHGIYCEHCMISIGCMGDKVIDSTGVYNSPEDAGYFENIVGVLSYEDMKPFIESSDGWNAMFDRSQIPELEYAIKNIVKDLEVIK